MKFCDIFYKLITTQSNPLFDKIIGYDHIKRLFRMVLDSDSAIHILLTGPPASARPMTSKHKLALVGLTHGKPQVDGASVYVSINL